MAIVPSSRKNILFSGSFPENKKKEIYKLLFEKISSLNITLLCELKYNHSSEGGLELPKTEEWIDYLNSHNQLIHIYQSSRQLRFFTDNHNNIIGARCKDGINIFTDNELDMICQLVNETIDELII
jgi:hypothetical protein